jgi:hypothetical protein
MIELTDQQLQALKMSPTRPARLVNPHTQEVDILLPSKEFERLTEPDYDDSPWEPSELHAQAWTIAEGTDWDDLTEAPSTPEPS